jgi:pimeloyl-ACP methyl ester carboxylesterase
MPTVTSTDGTAIAYDRAGSGPALVLVDGAFCHRTLGPAPKLVPLLARHFTVFSYDRRGRGETIQPPQYSVDDEVADLAAVIDASGGSAMVLGMSSGAALAVRAAANGLAVTRLALFEPPYVAADGPGSVPPAGAQQALAQLVARGRHAEAARYFLRHVFGMPAFAVAMMPLMGGVWRKTRAASPSLPHEIAVMGDWQAPAPWLAQLVMPTVVIGGERSPQKLRAAHAAVLAANPAIASRVLAKQSHNVSLNVLAAAVVEFFTAKDGHQQP